MEYTMVWSGMHYDIHLFTVFIVLKYTYEDLFYTKEGQSNLIHCHYQNSVIYTNTAP